jgi:hypothetical protein
MTESSQDIIISGYNRLRVHGRMVLPSDHLGVQTSWSVKHLEVQNSSRSQHLGGKTYRNHPASDMLSEYIEWSQGVFLGAIVKLFKYHLKTMTVIYGIRFDLINP